MTAPNNTCTDPPQPRERSNSFNWVFEVLVSVDAAEGTCPIRDNGEWKRWHRGRHLFVQNEARIARFGSVTRDFNDAAIEHIKHGLGQVYLDVSKKNAPDDFAQDLVSLKRSRTCHGCAFEADCTGLFEPVFDNLFLRDDIRVRELVGQLDGDVLDVGCGEGPYESLLAPLAKSGRIRYTGIDPETERIDHLRQRSPWGRFEALTAEAFAQADERFDHVLVLRSWNHLPDPVAAAVGLAACVRPGGSLLVVDNTAFGLARTASQTRQAESAGASRFEHFRNDTAADAHRALGGVGLRLVEQREVAATTSNQWLLRYVKPATS